jgi:hypothetical protein
VETEVETQRKEFEAKFHQIESELLWRIKDAEELIK